MSGTSSTAAKLRSIKTDAEWARAVQRRIEQLEHPTAQRIGKWVLSSGTGGALLASHVDGGTIVVAEPPDNRDTPDTLRYTGFPQYKVVRETASADNIVTWERAEYLVGDLWTNNLPSQDITVPERGVWRVNLVVCLANESSIPDLPQVWLKADGIDLMAEHGLGTSRSALTADFYFYGDEILTAGCNFVHGPLFGYPTVLTSLSLSLVERWSTFFDQEV